MNWSADMQPFQQALVDEPRNTFALLRPFLRRVMKAESTDRLCTAGLDLRWHQCRDSVDDPGDRRCLLDFQCAPHEGGPSPGQGRLSRHGEGQEMAGCGSTGVRKPSGWAMLCEASRRIWRSSAAWAGGILSNSGRACCAARFARRPMDTLTTTSLPTWTGNDPAEIGGSRRSRFTFPDHARARPAAGFRAFCGVSRSARCYCRARQGRRWSPREARGAARTALNLTECLLAQAADDRQILLRCFAQHRPPGWLPDAG